MNFVIVAGSMAVAGAVVRPLGSVRPRPPGVPLSTSPVRPFLDRVGDDLASRLPFDPMVGSRTLVVVTVVAITLLAVSPVLSLVPLIGIVAVTLRRRRGRQVMAAAVIGRVLPEVIDLLTLAIGSGLTLRMAFSVTAPWLPEPFGSAVAEVTRRSDSGEPFAVALEVATSALGPDARPLVSTLIASETDGAALLPALERVGDEARRRRRVAAEDRARRLPVAMLFPLVICVLPAFALLTVVPLLIGSLTGLQLPG